MGYIAPNSDLFILRGVPLDRNYTHTLYVDKIENQFISFKPYIKYQLNNLSYQRYANGVIRVEILADTLYDCNYIIFKNTAFGNKLFYAFVDRVEYISNKVSEIYYTIDVMQTWYFDYVLGDCYVEREHTETDEIGENVVEENLSVGELTVADKKEFRYNTNEYKLVILYVPNFTEGKATIITGTTVDGERILPVTAEINEYLYRGFVINNIYMGCCFIATTIDGSDLRKATTSSITVNTIIEKLEDLKANIVNMFQVPKQLYDEYYPLDFPTQLKTIKPLSKKYSIKRTDRFYSRNGDYFYYPLNKKLFCYPYKQLILSNNNGTTATYKWEVFNKDITPSFNIDGVPIISPEIMCYPTNYRKIEKDYESGIILNDFPTPPWSEDSFAKWWAQNKEAYITSLLSTAVVAAVGIGSAYMIGSAATGGALAGAETAVAQRAKSAIRGTSVGAAASIANGIGSYIQAKNTPDQISGQLGCSSLRAAQDRIGFSFYDMGVDADVAKTIDNYFTMFGYAIKKLKVPNVRKENARLRRHWNYIKTQECVIHAAKNKGLMAQDEETIANIYNNGITFWNVISEIGDYSLDNTVGGDTPVPPTPPVPPQPTTKYNIPFSSNICRVTQVYNSDSALTGHQGIDMVDTTGENKVIAITGGTVSFAGAGTGSFASYGNYVEIIYNNKRFHYAHLASINVAVGDTIKQGKLLGIAGQTGTATGIHLHLDIRENTSGTGKYINPTEYTHIPNELGTYSNN